MYEERDLREHLSWDPAGKFLLVGCGWVHGYETLSDAYIAASDYVECFGDDSKLVIVDLENARQTVFCPGV